MKLNGDTLSYRLGDFSGKEDRVLGDVLKKMPGIEVAPNGKISYNGKSISNFYIDGDNLLDDRYNIATKSIPKEAVDQVQIIENDQPIKMLRNKGNSDEVALNITIKPEARLKLMGLAKIAAGVPEKFEEDVNAMMFNKKYKGINYIKSNNIGEDIAADLVSHNLIDFLNRQDDQQPKLLLSTGSNSKLDLPVNRYLFNRAALINVNNLFNIAKEAQLKTNIHYLQDKQQSEHNQFTEVYLPEANISYTENQHTTYLPQQVFAEANLNVNKSAVYLSNTLMATYTAKQYNVAMTSNAMTLDQMLRQKTFNISNELNYMNTLKSGHIYNFYSFLNYRKQPEELNIKPDFKEGLYNGGIPDEALIQNTKIPSFSTNNHLSFKKVLKGIIQTYKLGVNLQLQELLSGLNALQSDQSISPVNFNGLNKMQWQWASFYSEGLYEYESKNEKLKASLTLPLSFKTIHFKDAGNILNEKLEKLYIDPRASLKYQTGIENYLQLTYN